MTNVLVVGAPTTMATSRGPVEQGGTPPPVRPRHRSGGSLLYAGACLGLLPYCDASLCLLIGVGFLLFQMWWSRR
jgi:hypothetical protein